MDSIGKTIDDLKALRSKIEVMGDAYDKLKVGHEVLEMEYEEALNEIQRLRDGAQDAKNEIQNSIKIREGAALENGITVGLKLAINIIEKHMRGENV